MRIYSWHTDSTVCVLLFCSTILTLALQSWGFSFGYQPTQHLPQRVLCLWRCAVITLHLASMWLHSESFSLYNLFFNFCGPRAKAPWKYFNDCKSTLSTWREACGIPLICNKDLNTTPNTRLSFYMQKAESSYPSGSGQLTLWQCMGAV